MKYFIIKLKKIKQQNQKTKPVEYTFVEERMTFCYIFSGSSGTLRSKEQILKLILQSLAIRRD